MSDPKVVVLDGATYLVDTLETKDTGEIVLAGALRVNCIDESALSAYLKAENLDALTEITSGGNVSYSTQELNADLKDAYAILISTFAKADRTAVPKLINAEFDKIRRF